MKEWEKVLVKPNQTMIETMKIIDSSAHQFVVVVDEQNRLLGTVTDGDIRRAILRGKEVNTEIASVMNPNPVYERQGQRTFYYYQIMKSKKLKQLPIVNEMNSVVDILFINSEDRESNKNTVVLMVGGLGTRLRPLTNEIPKPMLKVGNKPILETIIDGFKQYGYSNFIFSVNYKKHIIKDYFQNGEYFNVNIDYVEEEKPIGTAGALSLIENKPTEPFFVMNGDLLTQINYDQLMEFHLKQQSVATMCVREHSYQHPYGVIETDGVSLVTIKEKPVYRSFVNAGIYVLNPEVFDFIPKNEFYDMPTLFEQLIAAGKKTTAFPIREYWLDIGRLDEFERAESEYFNVFMREDK